MKAHLRYLSYVLRHKWYVMLAGLRTSAPLWRLLIHDWSKFTLAEWGPYTRYFCGRYQVGGVVEVESFEGFAGPAEIVGRRARKEGGARFEIRMLNDGLCHRAGMQTWAHDFEVMGLQAADEAFDRAWLHHQHASPHHWQHWVLREDSGETKVLEMPDHFAREMVADWAGAGRAITGKWEVAKWYASNRERMLIHGATRRFVEFLLDEYFGEPAAATSAHEKARGR